MSRVNMAVNVEGSEQFMNKDDTRWKKIKHIGQKMNKKGEIVVSFRFNKETKNIEVSAPDFMIGFTKRVSDEFIAAAVRPNAPHVHEGVYDLDISNANTHNIRKIVSDIVGTEVFKSHGIRRGFWGINSVSPSWYPKDVEFAFPNDNKSDKRLSREDCVKVFEAYQRFVWTGQTGPAVRVSHDNVSECVEEQTDGNEKSAQENDHGSCQPSQGPDNTEKDHECRQPAQEPQNVGSGHASAQHEQEPEKSNIQGEHAEPLPDISADSSDPPSKSSDVERMDATAKLLLRSAIKRSEDRGEELNEKFLLDGWRQQKLHVPIPKRRPTDVGRVDRRFHNAMNSFTGIVFKSTGLGDCLYCSVSRLLYGNESGKHLLRLASVISGMEHKEHLINETLNIVQNVDEAVAFVMAYVNKNAIPFRPNRQPTPEVLVSWTFEKELLECARVGAYSGLLQLKYLSCAINIPIQQHCLDNMDIYESCIGPCSSCQSSEEDLIHIMWSKPTPRSEMNHIQPVVFYDEAVFSVSSTCGMNARMQRCIMVYSAMCNDGDTWVQCENCRIWAHTSCVGMPDNSDNLPFSCCSDTSVNHVVLTWPQKVSKPHIYQIPEQIKLSDVRSLYPGNGVSDSIINMYLRFILSDKIGDNVLLGSTELSSDIFHSFKNNKYDASQIKRRHLMKDQLKGKLVLLFPLCITEMWHWVLVVVCLTSKRMLLLDSDRRTATSHTAIQTCLEIFIRDLQEMEKQPRVVFNQIKLAKVPKQEGVDCGVHVLENAKLLFEKHSVVDLASVDDLHLHYSTKGTKIRSNILSVINALATAERAIDV